jgi:CubicO group peptidase (beta-lactamase class C family)
MDAKRIVLGSLILGGTLAVARRIRAAPLPGGTRATGASYDAVDSYIETQMRRLRIPGVALAIVEGDRIVHLRGFGRARPSGAAPTPSTPFVLGSTTKSITALAVMQLVEGGMVDLDSPVRRYLPWFRVADSETSTRMTIRHLLNQTSGLPMVAGMVNLANLDDRPDAVERQARALAHCRLAHPPGAVFEYSNLNYNVLGLVVEACSGETYPDYVRRHIFEPLAMHHSHTSQADARRDGLAVGHRYWFAHPVAVPDLPLARGSMPSGQLISTSEDMAHYLIAHLNEGRFREARVLSADGIDQMHRGAAQQRVMGREVTAYGMGWFISRIGSTRLVSHGGNVPDFSSYLGLIPEQKKGVVLLLNADHYGLPFILMEVGDRVAALLAGQQPQPIRLGFVPWAMRALPVLPLLQVADVVLTMRRLSRRHRPSAPVVRGRPSLARQLLFPLIPHLSLAAGFGYLRSTGFIRYLDLYNPDVAWIVRFSGRLAAVWAVVRSAFVLAARERAARKHAEEGIP